MAAVAAVVKTRIELEEKIVLFCHHIATAQELTAHLDSVLPKLTIPGPPYRGHPGKKPGRRCSGTANHEHHEHHDERLCPTFVEWLCANLIRAQTWSWLPAGSGADVVDALRKTPGRDPTRLETIAVAARRRAVDRPHATAVDRGPEKIADAAVRLYHVLLKSKSSRAVLRAAEPQP